MAYQGNAAYRLDVDRQTWEEPARRPLSVHEGGRRDARSREAAAPAFAPLGLIAVLAVFLVALGCARVALTVQNVVLLNDLNIAETNIERAMDTRTELQIERSALTSTDRIQRIATQNYGMVYATDVETITVDMSQDTSASADDAQLADDADAACTVA